MDNYIQVYQNGNPIAIILDTQFYFKIILNTANHEEKCVFQDKSVLICCGYLDRRFDKDWSFRKEHPWIQKLSKFGIKLDPNLPINWDIVEEVFKPSCCSMENKDEIPNNQIKYNAVWEPLKF